MILTSQGDYSSSKERLEFPFEKQTKNLSYSPFFFPSFLSLCEFLVYLLFGCIEDSIKPVSLCRPQTLDNSFPCLRLWNVRITHMSSCAQLSKHFLQQIKKPELWFCIGVFLLLRFNLKLSDNPFRHGGLFSLCFLCVCLLFSIDLLQLFVCIQVLSFTFFFFILETFKYSQTALFQNMTIS